MERGWNFPIHEAQPARIRQEIPGTWRRGACGRAARRREDRSGARHRRSTLQGLPQAAGMDEPRAAALMDFSAVAHLMLAKRKHMQQAARVMDLAARRNIAACLRIEMNCLAATAEVSDFLLLLDQWESGLLSGKHPELPQIDPTREVGFHPS